MKYLLDTHIWLWSLLEPARLAKRVAKVLLDPTHELWLSPISVWEFLILVEKKRITLHSDPVKWLDKVWSTVPLQQATLNREVALCSRTLSLAHQDPADRFIAATAVVYDLTLVTADRHLQRVKGMRTLANV